VFRRALREVLYAYAAFNPTVGRNRKKNQNLTFNSFFFLSKRLYSIDEFPSGNVISVYGASWCFLAIGLYSVTFNAVHISRQFSKFHKIRFNFLIFFLIDDSWVVLLMRKCCMCWRRENCRL